MTVGDRIRQVRLEQDVTQQELADYIGVSKQAVYKYENNIVTNIPTDKLDLISKRLKVSPAYLMGWSSQTECTPTQADYCRLFHQCHGTDAFSLLNTYLRLDTADQAAAKILVEGLASQPKYSTQDESQSA